MKELAQCRFFTQARPRLLEFFISAIRRFILRRQVREAELFLRDLEDQVVSGQKAMADWAHILRVRKARLDALERPGFFTRQQ